MGGGGVGWDGMVMGNGEMVDTTMTMGRGMGMVIAVMNTIPEPNPAAIIIGLSGNVDQSIQDNVWLGKAHDDNIR